jgi:hypothetical protein
MSHVLVVTRPSGWSGTPDEIEDDDYEFAVECDRKGCDLWIECDHKIHLTKPGERDEEIEHGVIHREMEGGWCVPMPGCAYQINGLENDAVWDIARDHGVGRYEVDLDWWDWGSATLVLVRRIP